MWLKHNKVQKYKFCVCSKFILHCCWVLGLWLNFKFTIRAAAVLAEFRKIATFSGKNTIFNKPPVSHHFLA